MAGKLCPEGLHSWVKGIKTSYGEWHCMKCDAVTSEPNEQAWTAGAVIREPEEPGKRGW